MKYLQGDLSDTLCNDTWYKADNNHHLLSTYRWSGAICAHIQHFTEFSQLSNKVGFLLPPLCKPRTETEQFC